MSSFQGLRKFISERLTAAAEEIFTELEKIIVQFEEELNKHRLPNGGWKPGLLHHHDVWTEADQQLSDQEEPKHSQEECLQMKEEQEGPCSKQDEEQLVLKQESDTEERDHWQPQQKEDQLFCLNSTEAKNIDQNGIMNEHSGSSTDQELKQNMRCPQTRDYSDHEDILKLKKHKQTNTELCNQEWNSILNQKEPECPQEETEPQKVKEEEEELCISQDEEQLVLKQDTNTVKSQPEPSRFQIVSRKSHKAENQDQEQSRSEDFGSRRDEKLKQRNIHPQTRGSSDDVDRAKLNSHRKTHPSEKWYTSAFSGKYISQSAHLTLRGEKPWLCLTCGKHFNQNAHLIRHTRTHTGEKPYPCEICGKSFSQSSNLTIHMRTHTGEKPFSCQTCGKHFTNRRNLKLHENAHRWEGVIL